jgi:hypothetical protein
MEDRQLIERPMKGWTPWKHGGNGAYQIEAIWWAARVLHFPKLNVSCWFDGSDLVGIEHWGFRRAQWTMKAKPADWEPLPEVYRLERERERQEILDRHLAQSKARLEEMRRQRQGARDARSAT